MSQLRIVGGQWRSRRLQVADVPGLRPTPDRVRETLFNWLGQELDGWSCLDLFAGSGALGFEAASRGAAHVLLVERDPAAYAVLQQNARLLGGEALVCQRGDALRLVDTTPRRFDLIFLDPPFRQQWLERLAPKLERMLGSSNGCWPMTALCTSKRNRRSKPWVACVPSRPARPDKFTINYCNEATHEGTRSGLSGNVRSADARP